MPSPSYIAHASVSRSALTSQIRSAFKIEVRFLGGLNSTQMTAFKRAADRWTRVIIGDLPPVVVDGEEIDDLLIEAHGKAIDGPEAVLGESGPTVLRAKEAGPHAFLPVKGQMVFDVDDLEAMQREGTLTDVIAHEMGHVLGIGTIWARKRKLVGARSQDPTFRGRQAQAAYGQLLGERGRPIPVENLGGPGTRNSHWRESVFGNELMSGFIAQAHNPLSLLTVASLGDLGYTVDTSQAEEYSLPTQRSAAPAKLVATRVLQEMRRPIPVVYNLLQLPKVAAQESNREPC